MNCYVCAREGQTRPAVGLCRHCQVALCMTHHRRAQEESRGGARVACSHLREPAAVAR